MSENRGRQLTDFQSLVADLNAGVTLQQINQALSDIAANVCSIERNVKGKLIIELELSQIGDGAQVKCTHKLKSVVPKPRGRIIEEQSVDTPLHVCYGGRLTLFPEQNSFEMGAGAATGRSDGVRVS